MNSDDVVRMKNVAYVLSQATAAKIEMEGMKAENQQRQNAGQALAYGEEHFKALIDKYGLHHNAVVTTLNAMS